MHRRTPEYFPDWSNTLVLPVILEEQADTLFWQDVGGLQTCRVYGIKRRVLIETAVGGDLPLVVADHTKLQKLGEILLQWQDLTNPPLVRERLYWSNVRSVLIAVRFPIGKQIRTGCLVLGDVEGRTCKDMIAEVAISDVIARAWRVTAGRQPERIANEDVRAVQMPAQGKWLQPSICKAKPTAVNTVLRQRQRTVCQSWKNDGDTEICAGKFEVGNIIEDILDGPDVIPAGDRNSISVSP